MKVHSSLVSVVLAVASFSTILFTTLASAHEPVAKAGEGTVTPLLKQQLADAPGKQVIFVQVNFEVGQASNPHTHPGSVFAYVLEGEVTSQLQGHEPVTYKAGQSWYEPPGVPHLVSKNASKTHPAKVLAWLVLDEGAPVKEPYPKP